MSRKTQAGKRVPDTSLSPSERDSYGATVTAICAGNEPEVLCEKGTAMDALRKICVTLDAWPGDWRIRTISSPVTIMRDLEGSRVPLDGHAQRKHGAGSLTWMSPEANALARIGRKDLLP